MASGHHPGLWTPQHHMRDMIVSLAGVSSINFARLEGGDAISERVLKRRI
jgi:hypothetical protein